MALDLAPPEDPVVALQLFSDSYLGTHWKPTVAWNNEWDGFFWVFFVKGKLITKTYTSQNKLQFFFSTERACTTYRALLGQLRARPVHDFDRARILFQPAIIKMKKISFL